MRQDKQVAEALKPQYMIGCKRPTSHAGFLPVFNQPNVTLVDTQGKGIDEITAKGVRFAGVEYELDVLILATGGCHPGRLQDPIGLPKVLLPARALSCLLACLRNAVFLGAA
jgi:cation diffusion facilitator CzcD-associated flavoprotein CzcO